MEIRSFQIGDVPKLVELWNQSVATGEVVFKPMTEDTFTQKYVNASCFDPGYVLVAHDGGEVKGFVAGICQDEFLPGDNHENTPGYLSAMFVQKDCRRQGIGSALLEEVTKAFIAGGKQSIACHDLNPIKLAWYIPGAAPHDHNNVPGVDEQCQGFPFLLKHGFAHTVSDTAMYLNLADYQEPDNFREKQDKLTENGIYTGRYDVKLNYEFDGMCDRIPSEYWRKVLQVETAKENPRPILVASVPGHIVAFTGPVDKEESGRGWFAGICTDPLYEKKGIATVLFNLLMQAFIEEGATFSTLFTGSEHAQRIYARVGFRVASKFAVMTKSIQ